MVTDDLVAFMRARLDDVEGAARAAAETGAFWDHDPPGERWTVSDTGVDGQGVPVLFCSVGLPTEAVQAHIAMHDPAHELRVVTALRAVVELHPRAADPDQPPYCETCRYVSDPDDPEPFPEAGYPCPTVRRIAGIWETHEDWREEWR